MLCTLDEHLILAALAPDGLNARMGAHLTNTSGDGASCTLC